MHAAPRTRRVDVIQNCEVTGIRRAGRTARSPASRRQRGFIGAKKVGVVAAGNTSVLMEMADVRMPLESFPLQALVSEPVKPCFPCVVMSNTVHAYISQSDKGELVIGAGTDQYTSYSQTGGLHIIQHTLEAICEMFPVFTRMKMLRSWGGIVDVTPDRSPIIAKTPVPGLYVNCGWGTGGFKATPGSGHVFAHTIANDNPHPINAGYTIERFTDRPADRRGGCRRRGPLGVRNADDLLPLLRGRASGNWNSAMPARRISPADRHRRHLGRGIHPVLLHPRQRPRACLRALAACHGCGRFFNAARDTVTDKFLMTYKAGEPKPELVAAAATRTCRRNRKGREMMRGLANQSHCRRGPADAGQHGSLHL